MRFREFPVGGRFSSCPTLLLSSRGCASRAPAFRGRAARWLPAYRRRPNRRVIAAPKLYFSDAGVVNPLGAPGLPLGHDHGLAGVREDWLRS